MDIEKEYEEKTILVTGGAGCIDTNKLFFQTLRKFNQKFKQNGELGKYREECGVLRAF
jgi:FlaA1/EpsC-like NDP-sugar epimerase